MNTIQFSKHGLKESPSRVQLWASMLLALGFGLGLASTVHSRERPPPAVTEYIVEERTLTQIYSTTGVLEAARHLSLRPELTGRIERLHVAPGEQVRQDQVILEFDDRTINAEIASLENRLELARKQYERQLSLVSNRAGARDQLDIKRSEVRELEIALQRAQIDLEAHQISAPFSGVLGDFDWTGGSWITENEAFTTLDDLSTLELNFSLPERFLSRLTTDTELLLKTTAWGEQVFRAQVLQVLSRLDENRATLSVKARVDNTEGALKPGMRVRVELNLYEVASSLAVPARSLVYGDQGATVYALDEENSVRIQTVTTGVESADWVQITEGLQRGDRIVDRGVAKARPNRAVRILDTDQTSDEPAS